MSLQDIKSLREQGKLILRLKDEVYDLTNFQHPGGNTVLRTASLTEDGWGAFSSFHDEEMLKTAKPFLVGKCPQSSSSVMEDKQLITKTSVHAGSSFLASQRNEANNVVWWARCSESELQPLNVQGCKDYASKIVSAPLLLYWNLGNEDNESMQANESAWKQLRIRPRVLRDVRKADCSTTVLGFHLASPILVAPFATSCNAHPDGELAIARACAKREVAFVAPHFGGYSMIDIAQAYSKNVFSATSTTTSLPLFFQYYSRADPKNDFALDRAYTEAVFKYAEKAGYKAVFVTVDSAVLGIREKTYGSSAWVTSLRDIPTGGFAKIKTFYDVDQGRSQAHCAALSWEDIKWMSTLCSLKIVVKGIMNALDAATAALPESGISGIVVSNHGGRQMDGTEGTADVLGECVEAVRATAERHNCKPIEVYVDGGIRRGKDVLRALALGAKACLVGRPILWGLAIGGEAGVGRILDCLFNEFRNSMQLCGQTSAVNVERSILRLTPSKL